MPLLKLKLSIFILFCLTLIVSGQEADKDWPQIDGFSERTNFINSSMSAPFEFDKTIEADINIENFTYSQGVVYFSSAQTQNTFKAIDIVSGQTLWQKTLPETAGGVGFHPVISDGLVYIAGQRGNGLYALNKINGDSIWFNPMGPLFGRNVAIKDQYLYVYSSTKGLQCINKNTGAFIWEFGKTSPQAVPLVDDLHVYHYSMDTIYALNLNDGIVNWKYPKSLDVGSSTMSKDGIVYFKSTTDFLALNDQTGQLIWDQTLPSNTGFISTWNALTWTSEVIVVHAWNGDWFDNFIIQGFDPSDGTMLWSHDLNEGPITPSVGFGNQFALINGSELEIRNAVDGTIVQSFPNYSFNARTRAKVVDKHIIAANGSTITIFSPTPTGISDQEQSFSWSILNNPSPAPLVEIQSYSQIDAEYIITDVLGRMHYEEGSIQVNSDEELVIPIENLTAGVYLFSILHDNNVHGRRFVVSPK